MVSNGVPRLMVIEVSKDLEARGLPPWAGRKVAELIVNEMMKPKGADDEATAAEAVLDQEDEEEEFEEDDEEDNTMDEDDNGSGDFTLGEKIMRLATDVVNFTQ
jgi:hypothetical protein